MDEPTLYSIITGPRDAGYVVLQPIDNGVVASGFGFDRKPNAATSRPHTSAAAATAALEAHYGPSWHGWWIVPPGEDPFEYALGHGKAAVGERRKL